MAQLAMDYAVKLQPFRGKASFQAIADALNGRKERKCQNVSVPTGLPEEFSPVFPAPMHADDSNTFYVSPSGADTNPGTLQNPFATVEAALDESRKGGSGSPGTIMLRKGTYFLKATLTLRAADSGLTVQNYNGEEAWLSGAKTLKPEWQHYGDNKSKPLFVADLSQQTGDLNGNIRGLRVNGKRAQRARYPNFNTEEGFGSNLEAKGFLPVTPDPPLIDIYPLKPYKNTTNYGYHQFVLGIDGPCKDFSPPAGYWCGTHTRGGGGVQYHGAPGGMVFDQQLLPHSPYKNTTGAVVQMWRPSHWSSWMFEVGKGGNDTSFNFSKGGFQGARGPGAKGGEFYVENLFEEW
jgi:hypothetical protein